MAKKTRKSTEQQQQERKQRHRELEQQPPPPGFTLQHTLAGHADTVWSVAWSPDGQHLASASGDQTIRLWEAQTGQPLHTLVGHTAEVESVAWSPDGWQLASTSRDQTIRLWEAQTGQPLHTLVGHADAIWSVAWSPDGQLLASASRDTTIRLWEEQTGQSLHTLVGHTAEVESVAWSPDGRQLASTSYDKTIRLWEAQTGQPLYTLVGHASAVYSVAWSPDGRQLASASGDQTIRLWEAETGREVRRLERHRGPVLCISFSADGRLLASKSLDGTVRLWETRGWEEVAVLYEPASSFAGTGLAFHPRLPCLATLGEEDTVIRLWQLDVETILGQARETDTVHYTNAKVVLVGDSGVGKSGLWLVLTGQEWKATESTHGRFVWTFDEQEVAGENGRRETRETLLWDLAGQPGYWLIHQLHLNEVAVALVVFDARSETDPFAGVYHWERALRIAQEKQGSGGLPLKKLLVAARCDRGGVGVSATRIETLRQELGFDGYVETSAKEGTGIEQLREAIAGAIDWEMLPKVSSTQLFEEIKAFLLGQKQAGRLLSTVEDLYQTFVQTGKADAEMETLRAQFETCIGRVESRDLIRRLSFGDFVLLQPELLDAYASALVNAVKDEPDGLGNIAEEKVLAGRFAMPQDERIEKREQERLLLIAIVEDLLRYEIALREQAEDGPYLIFPSQSTREQEDIPDPEEKTMIFGFEGPVLNIYATLAVRLSHSGLFQLKKLWKNAVEYEASVGGTCGLFLQNRGEGRGELTLFFDKVASPQTRLQFEQYVQIHLQRKALPASISRKRVFVCDNCGFVVPEYLVARRLGRGLDWVTCPDCEKRRISLAEREERVTMGPSRAVQEMDRVADSRRDQEAAKSVIQGKRETNDFDVFLCYNGVDRAEVKKIGEWLQEEEILPWLDEWELPPGRPWIPEVEKQLGQIKSAAVFVGKNGVAPWQRRELDALLREFVERGCPVIPVLLADAPGQPELPVFLRGMTWVDFREGEPEPMEMLRWGITGKRRVGR